MLRYKVFSANVLCWESCHVFFLFGEMSDVQRAIYDCPFVSPSLAILISPLPSVSFEAFCAVSPLLLRDDMLYTGISEIVELLQFGTSNPNSNP